MLSSLTPKAHPCYKCQRIFLSSFQTSGLERSRQPLFTRQTKGRPWARLQPSMAKVETHYWYVINFLSFFPTPGIMVRSITSFSHLKVRGPIRQTLLLVDRTSSLEPLLCSHCWPSVSAQVLGKSRKVYSEILCDNDLLKFSRSWPTIRCHQFHRIMRSIVLHDPYSYKVRSMLTNNLYLSLPAYSNIG